MYTHRCIIYTHWSNLTSDMLLSLGRDGVNMETALNLTHAHVCFSILVKTFYWRKWGLLYSTKVLKHTVTLTQWQPSADLTSHLRRHEAETHARTHTRATSFISRFLGDLVSDSEVCRWNEFAWMCVFMRNAGRSKNNLTKELGGCQRSEVTRQMECMQEVNCKTGK